MSLSRRNFLALASSQLLLVGCGGASDTPRQDLLEVVTIEGFKVDANNAQKSMFADHFKQQGPDWLQSRLEAALNQRLGGIGTGPERLTLLVDVRLAIVPKTVLNPGKLETRLSSEGGRGFIGGQVNATAGNLQSSSSAEKSLAALIGIYVANMERLLRNERVRV
ncbi:MAG: hypothetical protein NXI27_32010 [Alphaproteobacteria bacterium]|nr:hypothetical protein [Alphaproteobacteria bacterium]